MLLPPLIRCRCRLRAFASAVYAPTLLRHFAADIYAADAPRHDTLLPPPARCYFFVTAADAAADLLRATPYLLPPRADYATMLFFRCRRRRCR